MAPRSKRRLIALAGAGAFVAAIPALGQQSPQSILPPGFNEPAQPAPAPQASPPPAAAPGPEGVPTLSLAPPSADDVAISDAAQQDQAQDEADAAADALRKQDVPDFARRPVDHIGFLSPDVTGIASDGFGNENGRYLSTLMARLDAPIASRWLSMLLRRVLTTDIATPRAIDPADWTAERALLLTRMGEAEAARLLVQRVDVDRATPRLYDAILQSGLAAADPGALCPVADQAALASTVPAWSLARAMCAGLSGKAGAALGLIETARHGPGRAQGVDLLLAQRVVGAGTGAKRAVDINWQTVDSLNAWRFGLASAVGLTIPDNLLDGGGLAMQAWRAHAPMLPIATRVGAARTAATLGVVSSADLVDAYAAASADADTDSPAGTAGGKLRTAYAASDESDRLAALRGLWADPGNERDGYAAHILTARAAERIAPSSDTGSDAHDLVAAMLSAGLDIQAARWAEVARGLRGDNGAETRALLAVGAPGSAVTVDPDTVAAFGDGGRGSARLRSQYYFAGLAGLGRLEPRAVNQLAGQLGVPIAAVNPWTRAIDGAAARQEPASVVLLAAVGMQTSDWTQVSPAFLYHIIADLRAAGFEPEARMIAAEALSRT